MSNPTVVIPVTIHIHLLQQQLLCLSRWPLDCPELNIIFLVKEPHPTVQQLLLLFQSLCPSQILPMPGEPILQWIQHLGQPCILFEPEAIPHPDLIRPLLECDHPLRFEFVDSQQLAARWFPTTDGFQHPDELPLADETEESRFARHDEDCLKWSAFQQDHALMTAAKVTQILTVHHADATGSEGEEFLSPDLKVRFASRSKGISKIKSSHTNMLFHPVHALPQADGRIAIYAIQETMKMGGVSNKPALFLVSLQAGLVHQLQPKSLSLPDFPFPTAPLPEPILFRPITIGQKHRLVFSTIMRNEGDKFLHEVISHAATYVDAFLVIDDCSTDNSIEVFKAAAGNVPLFLYSPPQPLYLRSEFYIRSLQWALTAELKPEWILLLDADERFEDDVVNQIDFIMRTPELRVGFPKFDMWSETAYRDDDFWCPHKRFWAHLIRYTPQFTQWHKAKVHSGRHPLEYMRTPVVQHPLRIKHLGWSRESERRRKHEWYLQIDDKPYQGNANLYAHIMDPNPTLRQWEDNVSRSD